MPFTVGWDIGGAHLKAAHIAGGKMLGAVQVPCPLWQGLDHLDAAFREAAKTVGNGSRHALTMTGELADLFATRTQGVTEIVACAQRNLDGEIALYAGRSGFVSPELAPDRIEDIAAANWHATASLCARKWGDGLLMDIGSTTADLIAFKDGRIVTRGYDDTSRLVTRELVYSAVVRTPIMAVARDALFGNVRVPVMAEFFATMADVYRLTGELPADADQGVSADGRGKSGEESAARLARMIGRNLPDAPMDTWLAMARDVRRTQLETLVAAACAVLAASGVPANAPFVIAGAGSFLAKHVAEAAGHPPVPFEHAIDAPAELRAVASQCAPAVAVALLLAACQPPDLSVA